MPNSDVRFGLTVTNDNGHHVHFRVFAATGGQHLGGCGQLVMTPAEYAAFRSLLEPMLTDRPDPNVASDPATTGDFGTIRLERVRTGNGGYRVFDPKGVGTGAVTYDPHYGDVGVVIVDGSLSTHLDPAVEARICHDVLELRGDELVFERLEYVYHRQAQRVTRPSDQAAGA